MMKGHVQIYRNLHRTTAEGHAVYSVRNDKGIVEDHVTEINLINPVFRVSEKGRERVRREGRKNVHAYIQGKRMKGNGRAPVAHSMSRITYNPYHHDHFVLADEPHNHDHHVVGATMVHIDESGVWAIGPKLRGDGCGDGWVWGHERD